MDKKLRVCLDRFVGEVPPAYTKEGRSNLSSKDDKDRLVLLTSKKWPKKNLKVAFLEGTPAQKEIVKNYAKQWTNHANITFDFSGSTGTTDPADIRIAFNEDDGSWSYLGVDALSIDFDQPTLNLGWITPDEPEASKRDTIIHEFGHALGCIHEHQHPLGGIDWNKEQVYTDLGGPPNRWPRETVDHNIFQRYDENITAFSKLDPKSVMMYRIPARWTNNGKSYGFDVNGLSELDIFFIKNMYPS